MLRKIVFTLIAALALSVLAAGAAGADVQYPPTGEGTTVPVAPSSGGASPRRASAPLARTGSDVTLLAGVAVVLTAGGAVVLVASRRRSARPLA